MSTLAKLMFQTGPLVQLHHVYKTLSEIPCKGEMVTVLGDDDKPIHHRVHDVQHDYTHNEVVLWLDAIGGEPPYR